MFSAVRITLLLTEINSSWIVLCKEGWAEILASKYSKWEKKWAHSRTGRSELSHRLNHAGLPVRWSPLLWYKIPSPFSISVWHSSSAHLLPTGKHPCPLCFWKSALLLLNWQKPFGCPGSDWSLLSHWQSISITVPGVEISSQPFRRIRGFKLLINSSCFTPPFIS